MQIRGGGLPLFPVALRDEEDDLVFGEPGFDRRERCRTPDQKGDDYIGKNDDIPKRQDRNPVRRRDGFIVALESLGQDRSEAGAQRMVTATYDYRPGALGGAAGGCGLLRDVHGDFFEEERATFSILGSEPLAAPPTAPGR